METVQRHADPDIPPWTERWSTKRRLGFGIVAIIPLVLLMVLFGALLGSVMGAPFENDVLPILFYTHVGAQFITLLVFGHLMLSSPRLTERARWIWAALFLFAAPFAIPVYWAIHVWKELPATPDEQTPHTRLERHVHVYDYDYTHASQARDERRPDGAFVHHLDATA